MLQEVKTYFKGLQNSQNTFGIVFHSSLILGHNVCLPCFHLQSRNLILLINKFDGAGGKRKEGEHTILIDK